MKYDSHYLIDVDIVNHKGHNVATVVTSQKFQDYLKSLETIPYETGIVPPGYEHRPDLISDLFYSFPSFDWLIMMYNNLDDSFQGLNIGDTVLIPKLL